MTDSIQALTTVASRKRASACCCDPATATRGSARLPRWVLGMRFPRIAVALFAALVAIGLTAVPAAAQITVNLSTSVTSWNEGAGATQVTVTVSSDYSFIVPMVTTVYVGYNTDGATEGTDYNTVNSFAITIPADNNTKSATGTFTLTPKQDALFEGDETIKVGGVTNQSDISVNSTNITLTDDDVRLTASVASMNEGDAARTVTVTATAGTATSAKRGIGIYIGGNNDSATEGTDYATVAEHTINIEANQTTGSTSFTLTPTQDNSAEGDESLSITGWFAGGGSTVGTSIAIYDDDYSLSVNPSSLDEDAGTRQVTVTACCGTAAGARSVRVKVGQSGDSFKEGTDYETVRDFDITIAANATNGTGTFNLALQDDGVYEFTKTITIAGTSSHGSVTGTSISIHDDDADPAVSLELAVTSASEAGGAKTVKVTAYNRLDTYDSSWEVDVEVGKTGDSATEGTDYATVADFTIRSAKPGDTWASTSFTLTPTNDTAIEGTERISVTGTTLIGNAKVGTAFLSLTDDDATSIALSANKSSVSEGASATTVTVTATAAKNLSAAAAVTVYVGDSGTADYGIDYAKVSDFTINIASGSKTGTGTFTLTPTDDSAVEGNETIGIGGSVTGHSLTGTSLTLSDNDTHAITLSASPTSVAEDASATSVTVTATAASAISSARTVAVAVGGSGTATSGTDYAAVSNFDITIAANATSGTGTFTLTPTDDSSVEGDETIGIAGSGTSLTVTGTSLTLSEDDTYAITLSASPTSVAENASGTSVTVTATAGSAISSARTVTVAVGGSGDGATEGTDYATVNDFTVTIAANATSGTGTFTLTPTQDTSAEGDETVGITGSGTLMTVTGTSLAITDDDVRTISLSSNKSTVAEGAGATTVTVTATANSAVTESTTVTVSVGDSEDGATSGTDYTAVDDFTVTIAKDATTGTGTFTLTPTDDSTYEAEESVSVSGSSSPHTVTGTSLAIGNNDGIGITLSLSPTSVVEGAGSTSVTVTATATKTALAAITLDVQVGKTTDSATEGTDYPTVNDFTLTIAKGSKTGTATFKIIPNADKKTSESNETISVDGTGSPHTVTGASLTLTNATASNPITLSVSPSSLGEAAGETTVTVTARMQTSFKGAGDVTVTVGGSGSAKSGTDYAAVSDIELSFSADSPTTATGTFKLTPTNDSLVESNETVWVDGSSDYGQVVGASVTINDNDGAAVTLSANKTSVSEGASATSVTVTATASAASSNARTVTVAVGQNGDGAIEGTDYSEVSNFAITIAANKTSGTGTFTLTPTQDDVVEGSESLTISGSGSQLNVSSTSISLTDDDTAPAVNLSVSPASVTEGASDPLNLEGGGKTVTVTAAFSPAKTYAYDRTVAVSVGGSGSATSGTDYDAVSNFNVKISAGQKSGTATFDLKSTDDSDYEGDETIGVAGTSTGLTVNSVNLTLADNDSAAVTVNDASAEEGSSMTFTVTLDKAVQGGLKVTPSYTNVTAADADYTANTTALTFSGTANETHTFTVSTVDDEVVEDTETFTVGLSVSDAPSGVTSTDTGTGTINRVAGSGGDTAAVTINDASAEEGSSMTFTVTLDKAVQGGLKVTPSYTNVTAADGDYTANTAALTFTGTANETRTFTVSTVDDDVVEDTETFTVGLSVSDAPSGVTSTDTGTGTINRVAGGGGDSATVTINDASADEGSSMTFTVTLDKAVQGGLKVTPSYTNVTAADGDYTANTAALTFSGTANETRTFTVSTVDDDVVEDSETFTVGLSVSDAPSGVTSTDTGTGTINRVAGGGGDSATVTINDASADEGSSMTFTVTLDKAVQGGLKVTPSYTNVTAADGDYTANTTALTFSGTANETHTFTVSTVDDEVVEDTETFTVGLSVSDAPSGVTSTDTGTGTINRVAGSGGDTAAVTINDASAEEGSSMTFTVTLDKAVQGGLKVTPSYTNVTAADGDYTANTAALTFTGTANETRTFTVSTVDDDVVEDTETFTVGLSVSDAPSGVTSTDTGTGTINRVAGGGGDSATVTINDASADEGSSMTFTVTLDKAVQGGLKVTPSYTNVTAADGDYTANTAALTFSGTANETRTFTVSTVDDDMVEDSETFTVGLSVSDAPSGVTSTDTGTGTINRVAGGGGDSATVTINDASADEGSSMTFTVTLDKAVQGGLTVTPSFTDVTTDKSTDYTENTAALTFTGTANETRTFTVSTIEDTALEGNETFTVGLSVSGAPSGVTSADTGTGTINNDDGTTVTLSDANAGEGESMTFTVTLSKAVQGGLTVTPSYTDVTAVEGTDYGANTTALTFTGTANESRTFTVSTTEDTVVEGDETFTVGLSVSGAPSGVTSTDTGTGTIKDDDSTEITLTVNPASVDENAGATAVTVKAATDGDTFKTARTVTVSVGDSADSADSGTDYAAVSDFTITITAGQTGGTGTFTLTPTDDTEIEGDEAITVAGASTGLTVNGTSVTLADDDFDISSAATFADAEAVEGEPLTFTVTLNNGVKNGFEVTPVITGGTATSGQDYKTELSPSLLVFAGTAGEQQTFTVTTIDDRVVEHEETVTVSFTVSDTRVSGVPDSALGLIVDNDVARLKISNARAEEGDSLTFTMTLSNTVSGGFKARPVFMDGTAVEGSDYQGNRPTLEFSGTSGESRSVTVPSLEDGVVEPEEWFNIGLSISGAPGGLRVGAGVGVIEDDDEAVLTVSDARGEEGEGLVFTVTLDNEVQSGFTVRPVFTDGSAEEGSDYRENRPALEFSGTAGESHTFEVSSLEDGVVEYDEDFTVGLDTTEVPAGVKVVSGVGVIEDDDEAVLTVSDASAKEGEALVFTVTLDSAVQSGFTVRPVFTDGSAEEGVDYTENRPALEFSGVAGESRTFEVMSLEDAVVEYNEEFTVSLDLTEGPGGLQTGAAGTGTIEDGTETVVRVSDARAEEGEDLVFTVTLENAVVGGVTVTPSYADGTALEGTDYTENVAALTFAGTAGESHAITVSSLEDGLVEGDETFTLRVGVTEAPAGVKGSEGTGTVADDDRAGAGVEVTVTDVTVEEGSPLVFTVSLAQAVPDNIVTLRYATHDGTAHAGQDYTAVSGTFTFAAGETKKTVEVATLDDEFDEGSETMELRLSDAVNGKLEDPVGVGTIENDDPLPSAWLARFGRTVGEHVMGAIDARLHGDSTGSHLTVGGVTAQKPEEGEGRRPVGPSGPSGAGEWEGLARGEGKGAGWPGPLGDGAFGSGTAGFGAAGSGAKVMTTRELLASSAFRWRLGGSEEGSVSGMRWTSWGSGAATRFDGRERSVSLDGEVVGMTLGVDAEWGPWTAGMAAAYNDGRGSYDDAKSGNSGKTWSTLTSVHPYVRWQKEGLSVWGLLGHGQGEYAVAPGEGDETVRTDMGMNMAGVGARRTLAPVSGGVELALRADGMFVWMNSDAVAGRLQETRTETRHLRLLLEGSRSFGVGNGGVLTPTLEAGVRHDAGDAERGFGLEVNARVRYEDVARGLTVEARGRGMFAHEVKGYEVWGASGSVVLDPGSDRLGLSLRVQPSWGEPESGVESLWDQGASEDGSPAGIGTGVRLDTELGYGLPVLEGRGVFTLQTGFGMDDGGAHRLRVGGVLDTDNGFELSLSGEQTVPHEGEPDYEVVLSARFAL